EYLLAAPSGHHHRAARTPSRAPAAPAGRPRASALGLGRALQAQRPRPLAASDHTRRRCPPAPGRAKERRGQATDAGWGTGARSRVRHPTTDGPHPRRAVPALHRERATVLRGSDPGPCAGTPPPSRPLLSRCAPDTSQRAPRREGWWEDTTLGHT